MSEATRNESEPLLSLAETMGDDGHANEVAITCIADGEAAILRAEVIAHVDACDACTTRVGSAALLSIQAGERLISVNAVDRAIETALNVARDSAFAGRSGDSARVAAANVKVAPAIATAASKAPSSVRRRPMPVRALVAAIAVAAIALVPSVIDAMSAAPSMLTSVRRALPTLSHALVLLLTHRPEGQLASAARALPWLAAAVMMIGLLLARKMFRVTRSRPV